jgi:hypothetical protein
MNYIEQLKKGNKLHIKYLEQCTDYLNNYWTEEIWEYVNGKFIGNYVGLDFTTDRHTEDDIKFFLKEAVRDKAIINIINKDGVEEKIDEEYEQYLKLKQKYEMKENNNVSDQTNQKSKN